MRVSGELRAMRRWLPITIVLAAAVAEAVGLGQIAFYLLLAAVPLGMGVELKRPEPAHHLER